MVRKYPLSDVACDSDALNVEHDIVGVIPRHPGLGPNDARVATRKPLVDDMELNNTSSDVDSNIGTCTEQHRVNAAVDHGYDISRTSVLTSALLESKLRLMVVLTLGTVISQPRRGV